MWRYDASNLEKNAENRSFRHSSHIEVHSLRSGVPPVCNWLHNLKDNFSTIKSFRPFCRKKWRLWRIFRKNNKVFQKLSFDCRIHIWHLFCPVFFPNFSYCIVFLWILVFLWVEILKFLGKTIIIWPENEKKIFNFQIVNCPAPLFRRLAKRHGETTGPNCLQASFLMSCRFQWRFHRLIFNLLNRPLQNSILCSKKRLSVIFHISEELLQWPPPGDFHRCLHWVVRGSRPTLVFARRGRGPFASR